MTPAEIDAWKREHGGDAGAVELESGTVEHRAADGSFIVVRQDGSLAMRGHRPPSEGAAVSPAPASPSTPAASPAAPVAGGGGMNQQEVEQWIAANGGSGRVQYSQSTREVDNPAADPIEAQRAGVKFDPTAPVKLTVSEEKWTAVGADGQPTGAVLHVRRKPDGNFDVVNQSNANPARAQPQEATAKPPEQKDEGGRRYVWRPNPGGPNAGGQWVDVGSAPLTAAERQAADANQPSQSVERVTGGDGRPYTVITIVPKPGQPGSPGMVVLGPDGQPVPGGVPGKGPQEDRQPVTKNGKTYIQVTVKHPDGRSEIYFTDQGGTRVTLPDAAQMPANAPVYTPDWNKPGLGIAEYAAAVRARPDLTDDQKKELISQAHQTATSTVNQATGIVNVQEGQRASDVMQRGQDASMANQRLSSGMSAFGNALTASQAATKYATGPDASAVLPYYLALSAATGQAFGGFNTPPRVQSGPAVQQMTNMTIPGLGSVLAGIPAAPGMPAPNDGAAMAEAQRQQQAAQQGAAVPAVTQGITATGQAAANPTAQNVEAANQAVQTGFGAAIAPLLGPQPGAPVPGAPQSSMQPSGLGAQAMSQSMLGYQPGSTNQMLLGLGFDPDIVNSFGGVG